MKKILIAAAIVCAAVMSQAATISWGTGTIYDTGLPGATGTAKQKGLTVYAYEIAAASFTSYGDDMAKVYADYTKTGFGDAVSSGTTSVQGKATLSTGTATSWANESTHYLAVIAEQKVGDKTYYIANTVEAIVGSDGTSMLGNIATTLHGGTSGSSISWQAAAVPEPTSGLLLLLGMAGLALRRRRA